VRPDALGLAQAPRWDDDSLTVNLRRPKAPEPEPAVPGPTLRDATPDAALDSVAGILRALRDTAVRDPDAAGRLEAWARHILVLAPPPGSGAAVSGGRDWAGLGADVASYVREDQAAVSRSVGDLQDTVWLVIERLSQAIVGDATADADAARQLERLRAAAAGSAAELKATALETVQRLSEIIDEKSTRQRQLARELGERVDTLKVELEDTRREADIDSLTQLSNRGVFQRELPRAAQVRTLIDEPACLAIVDIDDFKQLNDTHGHPTGDSALEAIAGALVRCFPRRADLVTRFGGDEFAVILRDATAEEGERLAQRFLTAVRELEVPGVPDTVTVTVSVGVAEALPGESSDSWFERADRALYDAKALGRNCVAIAGDTLPDSSRAAA
jgi:diguanylate cyclase (GGDEF)-like protein